MFSRRRFLERTALGSLLTALALMPAPASATQLAQASVGYQEEPHDGKRCELCVHYLKPSGCKLVTGPVSALGWCRLFSATA